MRRLPMLRTLIALSAAFLLCAAGVFAFLRLDRVGVAAGLLAGGSHRVSVPRDGLVDSVLARAGETVRVGQPLVRMDVRDLQTDAASLQASIDGLLADRAARRAEMDHLAKDAYPRALQDGRREIERAKLKLTQAETNARATSLLGEGGLASRLQVEQAELERKLAAMALDEADKAVPLIEAQQRAHLESLSAEIRRIEGDVEGARVKREAALKAIETSTLRAPADGVLLGSRLHELPGAAVQSGEEIARIATGRPDRFDGLLGDSARGMVRPDQRVKIRLEAYPWLVYGTLRGKVVQVSDRREEGGGFPVAIEIDPATAPGSLKEGMRGTARIIIEEKVSLGRLLLEKITERAAP